MPIGTLSYCIDPIGSQGGNLLFGAYSQLFLRKTLRVMINHRKWKFCIVHAVGLDSSMIIQRVGLS
jgi:hypothetical protein